MKKYGLLAVMVFPLFFLSACEESPREEALEQQKQALKQEKEAVEQRIEAVEEQKELVEKRVEILEDQKELYRKQIGLRLDEFETRVDTLRARAKAANLAEAEEARVSGGIDELERKKEAVDNQLDNVGAVGLEGWDSYKAQMNTAINNLEQSYDQINRRLIVE